MSLEYLPIVLESIDLEHFPAVTLYIRQGRQFVLYKDKNLDLSEKVLRNLRNGAVDYVFVRKTEIDQIRSYYECNLKNLFEDSDRSLMDKNLVLCSTMVNYISDVYQNPHTPAFYENCRTLLKHFDLQIADRTELLDLLDKVSKSDIYLFTHSAQVAILTMIMHQKLFSTSHDDLVKIGLGAMLHDIGMTSVSDNILEKNDALANEEYSRIKQHTRDGHYIASNKGVHEHLALDIILRHHEHFDGRGYPGQLSGYDIPISAQIVSICDIFSALTNDRPYRPASSTAEALEIMQADASLFNPEYLDAFAELISA